MISRKTKYALQALGRLADNPVGEPMLIADLAEDDLRIWTTTATQDPQIVELASTNALLRQPFIDGRSVDLLLTAEPGSLHGWMVTDIAPTAGR